MAVYTEVSDEELEHFVSSYDIGAIVACKGIAEGIENSNYLLQTDRGSYILTLYEKRVSRDELPFFSADGVRRLGRHFNPGAPGRLEQRFRNFLKPGPIRPSTVEEVQRGVGDQDV